jgi:hypothetical protein
MLEVCIPIYNSDVRLLVESLNKEIEQYKLPVSILLIDDFSESKFRKLNKELQKIARYIELKENVGRSKIRNLLAFYSNQEYLLYLDGDTKPVKNGFLSNYCETIKSQSPDCLFGGSEYQKERPERSYLLRWKYSIERESKSFAQREKASFSFKTNNFVIRKSLMMKFPFSEKLIGYGHEDTLFGFELNKNQITIYNINNPVENPLLDSNSQFLHKTNNALRNLLHAYQLSGCDEDFLKANKLLMLHMKLDKSRLNLVRFFVKPLRLILHYFLKKGWFTLTMFDLYRLLTLNEIARDFQKHP